MKRRGQIVDFGELFSRRRATEDPYERNRIEHARAMLGDQ
jgi:hypothetical protein